MTTLKELTPDEVQHVQSLLDKAKKFLDFIDNTLKADDDDFMILLRVLGFAGEELESGRVHEKAGLTHEVTAFLVHEVFLLRDRK